MKACRPLLGTYVEIRVSHPDTSRAATAVQEAFFAIFRVQQLMSVHEPESEISRINGEAHHQPVEVHPWTHELLALALEIHRESEGIFDCGVGPKLARWGLLPAFNRGDDHQMSSMADLELLGDGRVSARRPLGLDMGGIAKGFAVDKAADVLNEAGVTAAVINAGGDIRVLGDAEEAIHLRRASDPSRLHLAGTLQDGAIATSGSYFSSKNTAVEGVSALVDTRRGKAVLSDHSFSVLAPTCTVADALTKVLAITGDPTHACFSRFDAHPLIL